MKLRNYIKNKSIESQNSSVDLNINGPLEDKSLEAVIND